MTRPVGAVPLILDDFTPTVAKPTGRPVDPNSVASYYRRRLSLLVPGKSMFVQDATRKQMDYIRRAAKAVGVTIRQRYYRRDPVNGRRGIRIWMPDPDDHGL